MLGRSGISLPSSTNVFCPINGATQGVAYDRLADERSFAAVRAFLAEALAADAIRP